MSTLSRLSEINTLERADNEQLSEINTLERADNEQLSEINTLEHADNEKFVIRVCQNSDLNNQQTRIMNRLE